MDESIPIKWDQEANRQCYGIIWLKRFQTKTKSRDKEGYFILIKETVNQEYINILHIYAPNSGKANIIKRYAMGYKDINITSLRAGNFNTPLPQQTSHPHRKQREKYEN